MSLRRTVDCCVDRHNLLADLHDCPRLCLVGGRPAFFAVEVVVSGRSSLSRSSVTVTVQ